MTSWLPAVDLGPGQLVELLADPHRRTAGYRREVIREPRTDGQPPARPRPPTYER